MSNTPSFSSSSFSYFSSPAFYFLSLPCFRFSCLVKLVRRSHWNSIVKTELQYDIPSSPSLSLPLLHVSYPHPPSLLSFHAVCWSLLRHAEIDKQKRINTGVLDLLLLHPLPGPSLSAPPYHLPFTLYIKACQKNTRIHRFPTSSSFLSLNLTVSPHPPFTLLIKVCLVVAKVKRRHYF